MLGGVDVFQSIQCCISMGTYSTNHWEKFLPFDQVGCEVTLKGLEHKSIKIVDSKQISKLLKRGHFGFMMVIQDMPTRYPSNMGMKHVIEMDLTNSPIVVCPYQYGHFQKSKIERLEEELLDTWIITLCYPSCYGGEKGWSLY
jgi:hypothetical protein